MTVGSERSAIATGGAVVAVATVAMAMMLNVVTYNVAAASLTLLFIILLSIPIFRRLANADQAPELSTILLVALVSKMVASILRYWMVNKLYGGAGDSNKYDADGWIFAQAVRGGSLVPSIESIDGIADGTRQIVKFTGYLYALTGRSIYSAFFLYSWLAFWGCVLFARAAQRAFPEMNHRRYLYLVLFWPSLLFWPSALGKDALMVFFLGVTTYGAAMILAPKANVWGIVPFLVGVFGTLQIRAHVALMAILAVVVATAFAFIGGQKAEQAVGRGRTVRLVGLVVMVFMAITAATQTTRFFSDESGQATSTTEALELTVKRTQQGGSEFKPIVVTSPVQIPAATVSVLFRPFPWEARSAASFISALEAASIAVLVVLSWRRLVRWPVSAWRRPILLFAAIYSLMFVVAFSSIGNAGILARQRSQMLPLLFLAFAVADTRWWRHDNSGPDVYNQQELEVV